MSTWYESVDAKLDKLLERGEKKYLHPDNALQEQIDSDRIEIGRLKEELAQEKKEHACTEHSLEVTASNLDIYLDHDEKQQEEILKLKEELEEARGLATKYMEERNKILAADNTFQKQIDGWKEKWEEARRQRMRYMKERDELSEKLHDMKVAASDYAGMKEAREHAEERMQYYYAKADVYKRESKELRKSLDAEYEATDDLRSQARRWRELASRREQELSEEKRVSKALAKRVDDLNASCAKWKRRNIELQTSIRMYENMFRDDEGYGRDVISGDGQG